MTRKGSVRARTRTSNYTETQVALLLAALTDFLENGFMGASTRAIAEAAGVGNSTLFRTFGTKEELYRSVNEFCWFEINEHLKDSTYFPKYTDPAEQLLQDFQILIDAWDDDYLKQIITFPMVVQRRPKYLGKQRYPARELFEERLKGHVRLVVEQRGLTRDVDDVADELFLRFQLTWISWQHSPAQRIPTPKELLSSLGRVLRDNNNDDDDAEKVDPASPHDGRALASR